MSTLENPNNEEAILGQKYAFATASLLVSIAGFISLPGECRTGAMPLQKAQPSCRAGFQGAADAAAVAGFALGRFWRCVAMQVDDLFGHAC